MESKKNISHELIAKTAYYISEKRGFAPGRELDDWTEAEKIVKERELLNL
ncbi:MAG: DUF2934 domain-containing protein [Oligoflexales bacterium]|nr:DUF2934 domain-containing protein [Oligoflexales bacterium]